MNGKALRQNLEADMLRFYATLAWRVYSFYVSDIEPDEQSTWGYQAQPPYFSPSTSLTTFPLFLARSSCFSLLRLKL